MSGRANPGHSLETVVFNELARRGADLGYVKTRDGYEVDFFAACRDGKRELLQVCADPTAPQSRERELRARTAAAKEQPKVPSERLVLTQEQAVALAGAYFAARPAYEWLLEEDWWRSPISNGSGIDGLALERDRSHLRLGRLDARIPGGSGTMKRLGLEWVGELLRGLRACLGRHKGALAATAVWPWDRPRPWRESGCTAGWWREFRPRSGRTCSIGCSCFR